MRLARVVLTILGVLFVTQGTVQLFQPELLTDMIDISAGSVTGRIELKVIYGGLHIALGTICLWGVAKRKNTGAALTVMLFVSLGVAIPRVALGLLHRDFSAYSAAAMIMETTAALLLLGLLRSLRQRPGSEFSNDTAHTTLSS